VVSGLHQPLDLQFVPGDRERLYVVEQAGRIRVVRNGQLQQTPFLDLSDRVTAGGERGLLGLAFHPRFGSNGRLFVNYTNRSGDTHIAELIAKIKASPLWSSTVVIVTYDENGGFWDHVPPPQGDRWGPGTRIPAIIVSPFAKKGYVDHTPYDTTSIIKLITRRFGLEPLPGARPGAGDLTAALEPG